MGWLKAFRSATTQMSTTKRPMLSSAHAIFRGLEESLRDDLANLPDSAPTKIRLALINAHRKLSDYFFKIDDSPYYVWASILDPRITYEGLRDDCDANDTMPLHPLRRTVHHRCLPAQAITQMCLMVEILPQK
ncbi:uncharacterized protein EDB93DRAFT_600417 [Suillus bovinus]|uniref:uncharacterized protein n=1 Tax=Suillus bovinus TaxID=48563 RepID=UPI001B8865E7|nr:uncharacterized protein EDB93DRAFT_600417 [Suillus bovinus]KAG2123792.1 hypothetical protein EDB93DRAFT_600417 [Suillus bovinus]